MGCIYVKNRGPIHFRQWYFTQKYFISLGSLLNVRFLNCCFYERYVTDLCRIPGLDFFFGGGGDWNGVKK